MRPMLGPRARPLHPVAAGLLLQPVLPVETLTFVLCQFAIRMSYSARGNRPCVQSIRFLRRCKKLVRHLLQGQSAHSWGSWCVDFAICSSLAYVARLIVI